MKTYEMKAEPMTTSQLDRWLKGEIPRRHLALPFGGPIPGQSVGKADNVIGYDVDGEFFDGTTDFYGPFAGYGRERLVDWHHVTFGDRTDPTGVMKGAILGRIVLDDEPSREDDEHDGIWADFWANAGERRRSLIAKLERGGAALYGSSQPLQQGIRVAKSGHIDVWPVRFHTITTSPQNTHAVLPPMKAMLDDPYLAELSVGALRAFLTGADDLTPDLAAISGVAGPGKPEAKAGRVLSGSEADVEEALSRMLEAIGRLNSELGRTPVQGT